MAPRVLMHIDWLSINQGLLVGQGFKVPAYNGGLMQLLLLFRASPLGFAPVSIHCSIMDATFVSYKAAANGRS